MQKIGIKNIILLMIWGISLYIIRSMNIFSFLNNALLESILYLILFLAAAWYIGAIISTRKEIKAGKINPYAKKKK